MHQISSFLFPYIHQILGYVKHFFGCTECAMHFQEMVVAKDMWNVSTKDEAVLWLWRAHNLVSDRIIGDATDDPEFRKIKFPGYDACPECRVGFNFSEADVLTFLKNIHSVENIDNYGSVSIDDNITPEPLIQHINERSTNFVAHNYSSIVAIGICVCILFVVALMFVPRKRKATPRNHSSKV